MRDCCTGFKSLMRAFDLFRNGNRHSRIVFFGRQATGNGNANNARITHLILYWLDFALSVVFLLVLRIFNPKCQQKAVVLSKISCALHNRSQSGHKWIVCAFNVAKSALGPTRIS